MSNLHDREEAVALMKAALRHPTPLFRKYNENQERDDDGRFGSGGAAPGGAQETPPMRPASRATNKELRAHGVPAAHAGVRWNGKEIKDATERGSPVLPQVNEKTDKRDDEQEQQEVDHVYFSKNAFDASVACAKLKGASGGYSRVRITLPQRARHSDHVSSDQMMILRARDSEARRSSKGLNLHDDEREEVVGLLKATIAGPLHAPNPNALVKAWEDQERDELGRWGAGGGDAGMTAEAIDRRAAERVTNRMADKIGFVQTGTNAKGEPEYKVADEAKFSAAVAEYHAAAERDTAGLGGRLLNTDIARELSPDYLKDRTLAAAVHEPASAFIKEVYSRMLAAPPAEGRQPLVLFTAGGTGAGKSSGMNLDEVKGQVHDADIIFDTNMNTYGSAEKKVEQGLKSGREVAVLMVHRDPVDALVNGALPRSMRQEKEFGSGRTVPLEEHAKTHEGALPTVRSLQMHYNGDARFSVRAVDNSLGRGNAKVVPIDSLKLAAGDLHVRLREALDHERQTGKISESVYRGFKGPSATPHVPVVTGKELGKLHGQARRGVGEGPETQGWRGKLKALTSRAA